VELRAEGKGLREDACVAQVAREFKPLEAGAAVEDPGNMGGRDGALQPPGAARDGDADDRGTTGRSARKPNGAAVGAAAGDATAAGDVTAAGAAATARAAARERRRARRACPIPGTAARPGRSRRGGQTAGRRPCQR